jgi:putative FmdB family regulatory protein
MIMPDYSLICTECEEKFSFFGTWKERQKVVCPKCGSSKIEQVFSAEGRVGLRQIHKTKEQSCPMSQGAGCAGCKFR